MHSLDVIPQLYAYTMYEELYAVGLRIREPWTMYISRMYTLSFRLYIMYFCFVDIVYIYANCISLTISLEDIGTLYYGMYIEVQLTVLSNNFPHNSDSMLPSTLLNDAS